MFQIALYGKGGIGKSTVSANLSAALAMNGKSVLQIGCDPKHDSTRLLLGGASVPTVLDYTRNSLPGERSLEHLMFEGYCGVACIEAGGPEPGVGCAGRGILTTFEVLEKLGIKEIPFDIVLYDVLGDVVCGGFAVPLRKDYADAVFIVTSGEYMALYAANNILRGIRNFNDRVLRVAGIIHNGRGLLHEDMRVKAFAGAVGLPVVVSIPRSKDFEDAERNGSTLMEINPDSDCAEIFSGLAGYVERIADGSAKLYPACPLEDHEMESMILGRETSPGADRYYRKAGIPYGSSSPASVSSCKRNLFLTKSMQHKQPLKGCSFAGAVTATSQVTDALTIVHGPRSCSHIVSHFLTSTSLSSRSRYGTPLPDKQPVLLSTDMGEKAFIFGGKAELMSSLENALMSGWKNIFVVSTCPAGLIGDDIGRIVNEMKHKYPGTRIIPVPVDGNIAGDFSQGLVEGYRKVLEIVDTSVRPEDGWVNIVGEKVLSSNVGANYELISDLLGKMGLKVNCRLLSSTSADDVVHFKRGQLTLLAHGEDSGKVLQEYLENEFGTEFFGLPFPVGFRETAEWVELLAERFSAEDAATELIGMQRKIYNHEISRIRPLLKGKQVIISSFSPNVDWLLETAFDLGMHVIKVGLAVSPETVDFRTRYVGMLSLEYDYGADNRERDIVDMAPDLVLSNYMTPTQAEDVYQDSIPMTPDVGFMSGLVMAQRWSRLFRLPVIEGWKNDGGICYDN